MAGHADNQLWGDLGKGSPDPDTMEPQQKKEPVTREGFAAILLVVGAVAVIVGASVLWGLGGGVLALGLFSLVLGVLLGIERQ